ncbi:MAG: hypothetical protein Q8L55_14735 [Phycisphaerales bacterium]|nr:hypothetical protein [Phycisphaerales bacterium]
MIADSSYSSAFDDLADLFLGGGGAVSESAPASPALGTDHAADRPVLAAAPSAESWKPLLVEGLVLGHLPMMASLWASQYPRLCAAHDDAPVALVRLDAGTARVEVFHPPVAQSGERSRLAERANGHAEHNQSASGRMCPDLAGAISRAAQTASRIIIYSSFAADELLFARSATINAMAVLTGADDASAVGAYKAIKRLATVDGRTADSPQVVRVAVMGSEEPRANAAFHRLADAANSFLSVPIQLAGHCRQIVGGVPGTLLFDGPSAMTTQAVIEALSRPVMPRPIESAIEPAQPRIATPVVTQPPQACPAATVTAPPTPEPSGNVEATQLPVAAQLAQLPAPAAQQRGPTPAGLTPLAIHCPFERTPILAIDSAGIPQVIAAAEAGRSAESLQQLLAVSAWLWTNRQLLAMVCPALRTDAKPVMHLVTDRPCDVTRLADSDVRLHVRIPPVAEETTLALN